MNKTSLGIKFMDAPALYHSAIEKGDIQLSEGESHHVQVMRLKENDQILLVNGLGKIGQGFIKNLHKKKTVVHCNDFEQKPAPPYSIHLAIAPTKKWERMQFLLEKCTEIGIQQITPLVCHHSERRLWKEKKVEKTIVSALKQSKNFYAPKINQPHDINQFLEQNNTKEILIAHCQSGIKKSIIQSLQTLNCCVMIGPEGDFSKDELSKAALYNAKSVTLGANRLRTETAGLYACVTLKNIMDTR